MDVAITQVQHETSRAIVRDRRGIVIGVIERQPLIGKLIARDQRGLVAGLYDERSRTTRDARGRLIGQTNMLPVLLFRER
ncbi:MAG TPA: hypothetical protein VGO06_12745 [Bosea sp. (in: a-proteobacteria)]|jgi:hypothetical protein|uniref:hypothetical protein n=1 Tax=Bosea sp. (in: a-proteobacteria) TaxID=1871050 RepID=UPI002E0FF6FE|nr:hypothetical protein [Bosea sp. (in: a-proteobacteria)]